MSNLTPVQALPALSIDNEDGHDYSPERYITGLEARLKYAAEMLTGIVEKSIGKEDSNCNCNWCNADRLLEKLKSEGLI